VSWPTDETFIDEPAPAVQQQTEAPGADEPDGESEEGLWTRSRDFDWGD
jgi:hypothetical protein